MLIVFEFTDGPPRAKAPLEILMKREEPLVVTVQNIAEFWTPPPCRAAQVHDARLAAVMKTYGILLFS